MWDKQDMKCRFSRFASNGHTEICKLTSHLYLSLFWDFGSNNFHLALDATCVGNRPKKNSPGNVSFNLELCQILHVLSGGHVFSCCSFYLISDLKCIYLIFGSFSLFLWSFGLRELYGIVSHARAKILLCQIWRKGIHLNTNCPLLTTCAPSSIKLLIVFSFFFRTFRTMFHGQWTAHHGAQPLWSPPQHLHARGPWPPGPSSSAASVGNSPAQLFGVNKEGEKEKVLSDVKS